jgi:hypothetical protein
LRFPFGAPLPAAPPCIRHAAREAVDGALEEYRKVNAAFYIDKGERLREKILAAKGGVQHG